METEKLRFALKLAQPCIVGIDLIPVLQHYCFENKRLFAYDDVSAIIVGLDTELHCALRGETLLELTNLAGKEVALEMGESSVTFTSGKTIAKLPTLPPEEFVFEEPRTQKNAINFIATDEFLDGLYVCATGAGKDPRFKDQVAVTLSTKNPSALYAYDGTSLVKVSLAPLISTEAWQVLIPRTICEQILELVDTLKCGSEDVNITLSKNYLSVDFKHKEWNVHLVGKLLPEAARVDEYEKAVTEASGDKKLISLSEEFSQAVEKVAVVVSGDTEKQCKLEVLPDELRISGQGVLGTARTVLEIEGGQKVTALVDPERLTRYKDRLTHIAISKDRIAMYDAVKPSKAALTYVAACYGD